MSTADNAAVMARMIETLKAEIASKDAALAAALAQPARKLSMKVTEKGGLSVYGLGRFPVTLYRSQWDRLLDADTVASLKAFIMANDKLLVVKA